MKIWGRNEIFPEMKISPRITRCVTTRSYFQKINSFYFKENPAMRFRTFFSIQIFLMLVALFSNDVSGQVYFEKEIGTSEDDFALGIAETPSGGFVMGGYYYDTAAAVVKMFCVKTNAFGDTLWTKKINTPYSSVCRSVIVTSDSNLVFVGYENLGQDSVAAVIFKLDSLGNQLWKKEIGSRHDFFSVIQNNQGNLVACGTYVSPNSNYNSSIFIAELNQVGDVEWSQVVSIDTLNFGVDIQQTNDGGYSMTVASAGQWLSASYPVLIKVDSIGNLERFNSFSFLENANLYSHFQLGDNGYLCMGSISTTYNSKDLLIVRTDSVGDTVWTRIWGGTGRDALVRGALSGMNDCIYAGTLNDQMVMGKIDGSGNVLWEHLYGGNSCEGAQVIPVELGGWCLVGNIYSGSSDDEILLVKSDNNGVVGLIEDSQSVGMQVVPNPSDGKVRLVSPKPVTSKKVARLIDLNGKVFWQQDTQIGDGSQLDFSGIPEGTYIFRIEEKGGIPLFSEKIILIR